MTYSFNLIDREWIPCIHFNGHTQELSLREVLTHANELRGIQGDSPLETAAIYRLLLAVLHSALRGPRTGKDWRILWKNERWEDGLINHYLDQHQGKFDLFDPLRPFYQAADEKAKPKSVITLVMDMASGNNGSLFDHHTEETGVSLSASKAARTLLVAQSFGLAGLFLPNKPFTDAPWGRGVLFFLEGDNLYKTLVLNLLPYPDDDVRHSNSSDQPAWEQENPHLPDRSIPDGYLDYLTWQNRKILLTPEGDEAQPIVRSMTMAPGLRLDSGILDPMKTYRKNEEKGVWMSNRFSEERALWRDSGSFLGLKTDHGRPPQPFSWLSDRLEEPAGAQKFRLMALGMANDQAKVEFFREEHLPLSLEYLDKEDVIANLRNALDLAERTRFALKIASQWLALLVISPKSDGKKWQEVDQISKKQAEGLMNHWNVERFYWQQLDVPFQRLLEALPSTPAALDDWTNTIKNTAWQALEQAVNFAGTDTSALKAEVRAKSILGYSLKELFPEPQKEATA